MVDWTDPTVIQTAIDVFSKSLLVFLGLYFWEVVMTFDFEKSFFYSSTRHTWRWHYLCYFVCRYSLLISLITTNITFHTYLPFDCQGIYTVNQLFGNITIGSASLNLAFRALAIWRNDRVLIMMMMVLAVGHWFVLLYCSTTLKVVKNTSGSPQPCVVVGVNRPWLVVLYVYTMVFDTFIMVTCLWGLWRSKPRSGGRAGELYKLLWTDGLLYFICASLANALPVALLGLDLNPAMDVVSTVAAACITTIVSCRAVQRLNMWGTSNPATKDSAIKMETPNRNARVDIRKSSEARDIEHSRKPWSNRQYLLTEQEDHLSSAMFAKTVYVDNERYETGNGTQYEGQQKTRSDGGVFSLQAEPDDRSTTGSPTTPAPWKRAPSIRSGSTQTSGIDRDKNSASYKPTTEKVPGPLEQPTFLTKSARYQTSESIEGDDIESGYALRNLPGPPLSTITRVRRGSRVIEVGPTESGIGFGSGDSESDPERQQRR